MPIKCFKNRRNIRILLIIWKSSRFNWDIKIYKNFESKNIVVFLQHFCWYRVHRGSFRRMFVGIESIGEALEEFKANISCTTDSKCVGSKAKCSFSKEAISFIFRILGWFSNFLIALKIGSSTSFRKYSSIEKSSYGSMFKFLTAFLKNSLKISVIVLSSNIMTLFSIRVMLLVLP